MGRAEPDHGRFLAKFLVTMIPAAIASGIAVYVLYAVHLTRAPEPADRLTLASPLSDGLSTDERRELTRQMLKARRENPQVPAEVQPSPRPSNTGAADHAAPVGATDAKSRPVRAAAVAPAAAPLPAARPNAARTRPDAAQAPAVAVAVAPPAAPGESTTLPPGTVNTDPPVAGSDPEPRGFAANVFSSISVFAGTAANATGNTVNWVIDLPGKAISAGGRLLGGDSAATNPPPAATPAPSPAAAPPAAAPVPPPKRNYL